MIGSRWLVQLHFHLLRVQFNFYQTMMASLLVPPPSVRGQNKLDYEAFNITLKTVPCIIMSISSLRKFLKMLKPCLLKFPAFKPIQPLENDEKQLMVHLNPSKIANISESLKESIVWDKNYKEVDLNLTYKNWPCYDVLCSILPENIIVPTSFSQIGHIVHLSLRSEQLPYKNVIGQVFLDKVVNAKTVVNKVNNIDNKFRNFVMEVLAGEQNTIVLVKEYGSVYHFDFSKVYWNPRLSTEHIALVNSMKSGDILYDVFAGVGPFAIPSAQKGIKVLANDLNPESYKWLMKNVQVNKVSKLVSSFNKDGRDFLLEDVRKDILQRRDENADGYEHIVMNLPAYAVEFMDVFFNWFSEEDTDKVCLKPPIVHIYCFIKAYNKNEDFQALAKQLVEEKLGSKLSPKSLINIHHVRNVSTNKEMMHVSFALTKKILRSEEPAKKRSKLVNNNDDRNFLGNNGEEEI